MIVSKIENQTTSSIYVLLTDTGTLFTRLIKGFTNALYNHASIALDADLNELYSFGRKRAKNPLIAGFVREDVYQGTYSYFPRTKCMLLRILVTKQQRAAIIDVIRSFERNKHAYRYNLIGLIGVMLKLDLQPVDCYFCSQFVAETLRVGGVPLWDRPSTLVTPNDFLVHRNFDVLYEGPLYEYPRLNRNKIARIKRTAPKPAYFIGKRVLQKLF